MGSIDIGDPSAAAADAAAQALENGGLETAVDAVTDDALQQFVDRLHATLLKSPMKIERIDCSGTACRRLGFEVRPGVGFYTPAPGYTIPVIIDTAAEKTVKVTIRRTTEHRVVRWG